MKQQISNTDNYVIRIRYADDKPDDCRFCRWWGGDRKGCTLGKKNCYYLLPAKKEKVRDRCAGCSYGLDHPCIGYCLKELRKSKVSGGVRHVK